MFDVIIIGGSYAGLSAAMQLGRARRKVLIVDGGSRRNRFATEAHGFLGFDGVPPGDIAALGKKQVLAYPTIEWREGLVSSAKKAGDDDFDVVVGSDTIKTKRIILATGVSDDLPNIPGLKENWGKHLFHCPYCHGYELNQGKIGVLGVGAISYHQAALVAEWSTKGGTTLFVNDAFEPDADQLKDLRAREIHIERTKVKSVAEAEEGSAGNGHGHGGVRVTLEDGRTVDLAGLFIMPTIKLPMPLLESLGVELESFPQGSFVKADPLMRETTIPGVFACGDIARPFGSVSIAVADGTLAGSSAHRSLVFGPMHH